MSIILLTKIIVYTSVVIWLLPPIRQFKGRFFIFFLILGLMDPVSILFSKFFGKPIPFYFYVSAGYAVLIALVWKGSSKKIKYLLISSLIFLQVFLIIVSLNTNTLLIINLVNELLIFLVVLKLYITEYANSRRPNLFIIVLLFYELTNIFKFLNLLIGFADATAFFIITSIAQIAFGLFFAIFREDNPKLFLQL